ncbi:Uncharacterized protein HZ326_29204 [Fusarium oxysporum f. sp. albedinis]|nr:Uncharacterized protein HZ326_29204 [Fusarium oxysporum f. sp. albedinis]
MDPLLKSKGKIPFSGQTPASASESISLPRQIVKALKRYHGLLYQNLGYVRCRRQHMSTGQGLVWGWDIPQLAKKSRAYVLCSIFKGAIVKLLRLVLAAYVFLCLILH